MTVKKEATLLRKSKRISEQRLIIILEEKLPSSHQPSIYLSHYKRKKH